MIHFSLWVLVLPILTALILEQFVWREKSQHVRGCFQNLSSSQPELGEYFYIPNIQLLAIIGIFVVVIASVFTIRSILKPVRQLKIALSSLQPGKIRQIPEHFPREIKEIVFEINTILHVYEQWCHSTVKQADNLGHSLKNSLTIINNEAEKIEQQPANVIRHQVNKIIVQIDRFTALSAASLRQAMPSEKIVVKKVVQDIFMIAETVYLAKKLSFFQRNLEGLFFYGDYLDLEEILGNLIDNASKWANQMVVVSGKYQQGQLALAVDDDGPGIPEDQFEKVFNRGYKLDEQHSGQGLGLDIVQNIVQLYGGRMVLSKSGLGGLRVAVFFPVNDNC